MIEFFKHLSLNFLVDLLLNSSRELSELRYLVGHLRDHSDFRYGRREQFLVYFGAFVAEKDTVGEADPVDLHLAVFSVSAAVDTLIVRGL